MRVVFVKGKEFDYNYYWYDWSPDQGDILGMRNRLENMLTDNYPSLDWCGVNSFRFDDNSDEAAFLLWSAGGVDI